MGWFILTQLFSILIQLIRIGGMSNHEKDLEIMILRYQLDMAERKRQPLKPTRFKKLALAVLVTKLKVHSDRQTNCATSFASFNPKPYCAGIANWSAASGPTISTTKADVLHSITNLKR